MKKSKFVITIIISISVILIALSIYIFQEMRLINDFQAYYYKDLGKLEFANEELIKVLNLINIEAESLNENKFKDFISHYEEFSIEINDKYISKYEMHIEKLNTIHPDLFNPTWKNELNVTDKHLWEANIISEILYKELKEIILLSNQN